MNESAKTQRRRAGAGTDPRRIYISHEHVLTCETCSIYRKLLQGAYGDVQVLTWIGVVEFVAMISLALWGWGASR